VTFALARLAASCSRARPGLLIGHLVWLLAAAAPTRMAAVQSLPTGPWLRLRSQIDPPPSRHLGDVIGQVCDCIAASSFTSNAWCSCSASCAARPPRFRRRDHIEHANEIVWFNRQAARLLGLRAGGYRLRIDNLIRSPEFVHYLHGDDFTQP